MVKLPAMALASVDPLLQFKVVLLLTVTLFG